MEQHRKRSSEEPPQGGATHTGAVNSYEAQYCPLVTAQSNSRESSGRPYKTDDEVGRIGGRFKVSFLSVKR